MAKVSQMEVCDAKGGAKKTSIDGMQGFTARIRLDSICIRTASSNDIKGTLEVNNKDRSTSEVKRRACNLAMMDI